MTSFQQVMSPNSDTLSSYSKHLLDGSNYISWKMDTESFLQSKGLSKFIRFKLSTLLDDPALSADKLMDLRDGDEMALGHIKTRCNDSFKEMLIKCKTARKAWKTLAGYFEGRETFNKIHLMERLMDDKLRAEGDIVDNVQSFLKEKKQIVRRLAECGIRIPEELQVAILLSRLPETMDTMRRILEADADITVDKVARELLRESVRLSSKRKNQPDEKAVEQVNAAMMKRQKTYPRTDTVCTFCGTPGNAAVKCWLNPQGTNFRQTFAERVKKTAEAIAARHGHSGSFDNAVTP